MKASTIKYLSQLLNSEKRSYYQKVQVKFNLNRASSLTSLPAIRPKIICFIQNWPLQRKLSKKVLLGSKNCSHVKINFLFACFGEKTESNRNAILHLSIFCKIFPNFLKLLLLKRTFVSYFILYGTVTKNECILKLFTNLIFICAPTFLFCVQNIDANTFHLCSDSFYPCCFLKKYLLL